jgi:hypothetical protein
MEAKTSEDVRRSVRAMMEANLRTSIKNMRAVGLSKEHINRFVADQKTRIEKEVERAVAAYERLKANPDAGSIAVN